MKAILMLMLLGLPITAAQAVEPPRDLTAVLTPIRERHKLPGLAATVVEGTDVVARGASGVRRVGDAEPVTVDDQFHIGSCTKAMTATMIATLVEEGKLAWKTTLGDVFGDLNGGIEAAWRPVTMEQLLTHHGGAPPELFADGLWMRLWLREGTPREQRLTLVKGVLPRAPFAPPGTRFVYSNAGYALAGAMAEKVTDTAWEDLMRRRLFEPLGMTSAGFGAPGTAGALDQPRGHLEGGAPVEPGPSADNPPAIAPAGGVHCTLNDWAKYVALHLVAAQGRARLLKPETFAKLHAPVADDSRYAMGWAEVEREWAGGPATNQGGKAAREACDEAAAALVKDCAARAGN